jgi:trigger factor
MEVSVNQKKEYLKEISVLIDKTEVDKKIEEILNEYRGKIIINGFRKGKVPTKIILRKLGKELEEIACQEIIEETVRKIVKEKNFKLISEARLTEFEFTPDKSLRFTALLEVFPEFTLKEYKGIPVTTPEITGFDQEFERRVRYLQERCATYRSIDQPAVNGNILFIDYKIFLGDEKINEALGQRFRLGDERNLPELNEGLLGLKRGEKKEISVKIPESYPDERIRGKEVRFEIVVRDVKEEELPELNEEFAKNLGYSSLADLGEEIKRSILDEWEEIKLAHKKREIEKYLLREHEFEVPQSLVERELSLFITENNLPNSEETRERFLPIAQNRARLRVILHRIAEKENLFPTEEEKEEFLSQLSLSEEEKAKLVASQFIEESVLKEKVMDFLVKEAKEGGKDVLHTNCD